MAASPSMAQVCMESTNWHKISIIHHEDAGAVGTTSSPSSELLPFAAQQPHPPLERRLRPQHEQALKCPRCDSTHTKFCYYNNYSLSQPRYFCKTCRRYWTKGGSLRNVPVGGGCRKNKRSSSAASSKIIKPPAANDQILSSAALPPPLLSSFRDAATTDLHLSFSSNPRLPHLDPLIDAPRNLNFMDFKYNHGLDQNSTSGFDFIESCKFGAMLGSSMANMEPIGFNGIGFGSNTFAVDGTHGAYVDPPVNAGDVKPGSRMLSLEWQEQGCAEVERDSFGGYTNCLGLWAGMINGHHGSSSAAI